MKALVLKEQGVIALEERSFSEALSPTDVRVSPKNVGICGSDLHYYLHGRIGDFVLRKPMVLGHEASGIVTEVGSRVSHLKVGDPVCMEPGIPDFTSPCSLEGSYNLDPSVTFWATPPVDGCARESVVHPACLTFKLPDGVSLEEGALIEPLSIGVYAAQRGRVSPGDVGIVLGAGTIGLVTALAARAAGCSKVIITDVKQGKLDFIRRHYEDNAFFCVNSAREELQDIVASQTRRGADLLFEASGTPSAIESIPRYLRPGGRAIMIGMPQAPAPIDIVALQCKEITIKTIFRYVNVFPRALDLIASGSLKVRPLVTHRFPLSQGVEAFKFAKTMPENAVKIMLEADW